MVTSPWDKKQEPCIRRAGGTRCVLATGFLSQCGRGVLRSHLPGAQPTLFGRAGVWFQAGSGCVSDLRRRGVIFWLFLTSSDALPLSPTDATSLRARSAAPSSFLRTSNHLRDLGQTWCTRPFPGPAQLPNPAQHRSVRPQPRRAPPSLGGSDRSAWDMVLICREQPNLRPSPLFLIGWERCRRFRPSQRCPSRSTRTATRPAPSTALCLPRAGPAACASLWHTHRYQRRQSGCFVLHSNKAKVKVCSARAPRGSWCPVPL